MKSLGSSGATDYIDIVIIHPLPFGNGIAQFIYHPTDVFVNAAKEKEICHYVITQSAVDGSKFHLMAIYTLDSLAKEDF